MQTPPEHGTPLRRERMEEPLPPADTAGCLWLVARTGCGMAILQILMALAILAVALISLLFFR